MTMVRIGRNTTKHPGRIDANELVAALDDASAEAYTAAALRLAADLGGTGGTMGIRSFRTVPGLEAAFPVRARESLLCCGRK